MLSLLASDVRDSQTWAHSLASEAYGYVRVLLDLDNPKLRKRAKCYECGQERPFVPASVYEGLDERRNKTRLALHMQERAAAMYEQARDDYEWFIERETALIAAVSSQEGQA
jgi:hypothetical protein